MNVLPEEVINLILNKLPVKDLILMLSINKYYYHYNFDYKTYLSQHDLTNIDVDKSFMKIHGQYLYSINKKIDVNQWLYFFETLLEINKQILIYSNYKYVIEFTIVDSLGNDYLKIDNYDDDLCKYFCNDCINITEDNYLTGTVLDNMIQVMIDYFITEIDFTIEKDDKTLFKIIKDR